MVTLDDVAGVVKDRLDASAAFAAAVPGLAWLGRADENASPPYAVFAVEQAGDPEPMSDLFALSTWDVRVAVYAPTGAAGVDPGAIQLGLADAIAADPTGWGAVGDGAVVHCLPRAWDGKFDPRLRDARDVFVCGGRWAMTVDGPITP